MRTFGVLLLLAIGGGPAVWGTTFYQRPFPATVKEAEVIVRGKIGMNYTNWVTDPSGSRKIYTFYELQLDEVVKGSLGPKDPKSYKSLMIRSIGGEKGGVGLDVPGAARFERGEDVVVMLGDRNPDDTRDIRGLMMGKYDVVRDAQGRETLQGAGINPSNREGVADDHEAAAGHNEEVQGGTRWTMDALRDLVRSQAESPPAGLTPPVVNSAKIPTVAKPAPSPLSSISAVEKIPAPPLHQEEGEGRPSATSTWIIGLVALIFVVGALTVFRNKGQ